MLRLAIGRFQASGVCCSPYSPTMFSPGISDSLAGLGISSSAVLPLLHTCGCFSAKSGRGCPTAIVAEESHPPSDPWSDQVYVKSFNRS